MQVDAILYLDTFLTLLLHPKPGTPDILSIDSRRAKYRLSDDTLQVKQDNPV